MQAPFLLSAAVTLAVMVSLQTLIAGVILHCSEPASWASIAQNYRLSIFVGITSALGSLGWFTAMTYEQAAYVKALGQIEFVFTIAITCWVFKEQISRVEYVGIGLVILAVITLLVGL